MLSKLLKYDLRANLKIYLFVWPPLITLALIDRLSLAIEVEGTLGTIFVIMTTSLFILALIAACVLAVIISIVRFYSGLLRNEGYLMFTLPVKSWQLILSKFLTALLTLAVTVGLSILCGIFVFGGVDGMLEILSAIFSANAPTGLTMLLTVLLCVASLCVSILQIYLSCSIGHLFRRRRILFSILFYYAINIAVEFFSLLLMVGIVGTSVIDQLLWMNHGENILLAVLLVAEIALGCVYFFVSERLLRRHLNLE